MQKKVVLIIAQKGYQPIEYGIPKRIITDAGINVVVASNDLGMAYANSNNDKIIQFGTALIDIEIKNINPLSYDGFFIIGGPGAMNSLNNDTTYKFLNEIAALKKPFGAICISPRILAKSGVLKNKNATGWDEDHQLTSIFNEHAITYIKNTDVVVDNNIITATGPIAAQRFGKAIVSVINE